MSDLEQKQLHYLDLFDGVTRSLADADAETCMYNIQRLANTASARGVKVTPEACQMMAETLRAKGYQGTADEGFEVAESLNGPIAQYAERIEAGEISPSVEDIQKVYFAGVIDCCEHPEKPTHGHGNMNAALCDAVVAVEKTQNPSLAVEEALER